MSLCDHYNPNKVYAKFEVVEFPISYVGFNTRKIININVDLEKSAYIKTSFKGKLMKFEEARNISPSHRAFNIHLLDDFKLEVIFAPTNECISKAKKEGLNDNRLVCDLRIITIATSRCCDNEFHSEIGRFYLSGQFEYCSISHVPEIVNFGDVYINTEVTKSFLIQNNSNIMVAKMLYVKIPGFMIMPSPLVIPPSSTKGFNIKVKPVSLQLQKVISFKIISPYSKINICTNEIMNNDEFISYNINVKINIIYKSAPKTLKIESLHKLLDFNPKFAYTNEELSIVEKRKSKALKYLKTNNFKTIKSNLKSRNNENRCISMLLYNEILPKILICDKLTQVISTYDSYNIQLAPFCLNFGKVALLTKGKSSLSIKNDTQFEVNIKFLKDEFIKYTNKEKPTQNIKLKPFAQTNMIICCFGNMKGNVQKSFDYIIQDKYYRRHFYSLDVSDPNLTVKENSLKLGMITPECFTLSVPLVIYNDFNVPIEFKWNDINSEMPVEINPENGVVPPQSARISEVTYVFKETKSKILELNLVPNNDNNNLIPIELSIITKKLSIKFLQSSVLFKDIPFNLETIEKVKMENLSREVALFHVVEQLIPGTSVEPQGGVIRPKEIITLTITVQIPCALEFSFDLCVKINNKENIILPISGNVVEPKLNIYPKIINVSQIPCDMITYVPIMLQNVGTSRTVVDILDSGHDNFFNIYSTHFHDSQKLKKIIVDEGQTKTVYVRVYDNVQRKYEMYVPFRINGILGPPNSDHLSTELHYYIADIEKLYENNPKIKIEHNNKTISSCHISGVLTSPWIKLSREIFEILYEPNKKEENEIEFTMTNVSKYNLFITILTSRLPPNFTLNIKNSEYQKDVTEHEITFELGKQKDRKFSLSFHPKEQGIFQSTALMYLDKSMSMPFYNLSFLGTYQAPKIIPSTYRLIFPPCNVGETISKTMTLTVECKSGFKELNLNLQDDKHCKVKFVKCHEMDTSTIMTVEIIMFSVAVVTSSLVIGFCHSSGSACDVEVYFCFTVCPITLHMNSFSKSVDISYPYYPTISQVEFYEYMGKCTNFLENWMFQQGFRRDLYPEIPSTFHTISSRLSSQPEKATAKGNIVSYLSFIRRIVGPLMKHIHKKKSVPEVVDTLTSINEIHDTYQDIINLLKSCGANICTLQAKFLLSYEDFVVFTENTPTRNVADVMLVKKLKADIELFDRLNKQSWIDFILQSYKVFIMDNCFPDNGLNTQVKNAVTLLINWFNENLRKSQWNMKYTQNKVISDLTTDLSDGICIIASIINFCPFMEEHFVHACKVDFNSRQICIINNACLIIGALNNLKIYFPLKSNDFLEPNFLQMLFLSIHLYVSLPMFEPKEEIYFNSPLLKSSSRELFINSISQERLTYNFILINNTRNSFMVEKGNTDDKKRVCFILKFVANFVDTEKAILLLHGYNRSQIFDTFIVFLLQGSICTLYPLKKCKVIGTLYKPDKVDILISSPLSYTGTYSLYLTNNEPTIPVLFDETSHSKFLVQRLNLIDKEIYLNGTSKEAGETELEHKLYLQIICLNTAIKNSWIWFRSEKGEFFIKITSHARWDIPVDTLYLDIDICPKEPCECYEECKCILESVINIPHQNEAMLKSLRLALCENSSEDMVQVFDKLIKSVTGRIILTMLMKEGGTYIPDIQHILRSEINYTVSSTTVTPLTEHVTLNQESGTLLELPIALSARNRLEKTTVTLTSDCGMDIRIYRIMFVHE